MKRRSHRRFVVVSVSVLCLALVASAAIPFAALASHFRFGHVTWIPRTDLGPNAVEFTYLAAFRRNSGLYPGSGTDGFAIVGDCIEEAVGETTLAFGDDSATGVLSFDVIAADVADNYLIGRARAGSCGRAASSSRSLGTPTDDPRGAGGDGLTHEYAQDGTYTAVSFDCCRLQQCSTGSAHVNNPEVTGDVTQGNYRLQSLVNVGTTNSSPVSSLTPIVNCPAPPQVCSFVVPASDNESAVSFRLATIAESRILRQPGNPANGCSGGSATIDPATGMYSWDTTGCRVAADVCTEPGQEDYQTLYSTQVIIEDEDGATVPIDFFIRLGAGCDPQNSTPAFDSAFCGTTIPTSPDELVALDVTATDADAGDVVTLRTAGLPAGASQTPSLPISANPAASVFSWTPTEAQIGQHVITYTATDDCGAQSLCSVTIDVSNEDCSNGEDDDGDDLVDCLDPDCAGGPGSCSVDGVCVLCGRPISLGGNPTASDALFVLRAGVDREECELCVCDTNDDGRVSATDSLLVLRLSVGLPAQLRCPA